MEELIRERTIFENELYDNLINLELFIPESFWEPVNVSLTIEQINNLKEIDLKETCSKETCLICNSETFIFKELRCCKKQMCNSCIITWFNLSVKCPYCNFDQRT